jgi:parvulin-like peptidyl-prolyl isomerase
MSVNLSAGRNARKPWAAAVFCAALLAAVLMAPPVARCARTTLDKSALVVNQDVVTENELEEAIAAYFAAQGRQTPPIGGVEYKKARNEITDTVINELLMSQAADAMGVTIADEDLDRQVDQQIDGIRKHFATKKELQTALALEGITEDDLRAENHRKILRQMKAQRAMAMKRDESKDENAASKDAVKARFDKSPSDFDHAKFSIILFRVPDGAQKGYGAELKKQAEDLKKKIEGGADFAGLAKKYSEDTLSAEHGGDMGELTHVELTEMDRSLAKAVFTQPIKQLAVVSMKNSVCLVKVMSRQKASFSDAAPMIQKLLQGKQQVGALDEWVKDLKAKAYIKKY